VILVRRFGKAPRDHRVVSREQTSLAIISTNAHPFDCVQGGLFEQGEGWRVSVGVVSAKMGQPADIQLKILLRIQFVPYRTVVPQRDTI
jgi:hypothetical protein